MSFSRQSVLLPLPKYPPITKPKTLLTSTLRAIPVAEPPLIARLKQSSRQSLKPTTCSTVIHKTKEPKPVVPHCLPRNTEKQIATGLSTKDECTHITNNLQSIVKRSEKRLLTPVHCSIVEQSSNNFRRTKSLRVPKANIDRRSNVQPSLSNNKIHDFDNKSISDRSSEHSSSGTALQRRSSVRNISSIDKFSGIRCYLQNSSTKIQACKLFVYDVISNDRMLTIKNNIKDSTNHSPWRERFQMFLSNVSPNEPIANKNSNKENQTPTFHRDTKKTFNVVNIKRTN
ncbi:unnamed protein product [Didymodactylos carnosus]|uniref:Uncharacterized protein n=1 Tax=Didymodactylos carnosus TaxID=1234261 RepID=A0A814ALH9_9BILA|nr:unnamed protein product [Didymodactylos carnosus]CAF1327216.1 unnamed protein product [Didymodactylos carnosus]CAF3696658.1 unnamed protein product [Didymodactylos carnosus]CAF4138600.1 unnamed protein product [Didymodactylos carnosus]